MFLHLFTDAYVWVDWIIMLRLLQHLSYQISSFFDSVYTYSIFILELFS